MKYVSFVLVCLLVGAYIGFTIERNEWEKAYKAFSDPREFCLLWTNDNGMHGFQYKNKTYPLMTTKQFKEIINSQIWFDK